MTMLLVINAFSSLLATVGIGGFLLRKNQRDRRKVIVQPLYVSSTTPRPLPRD
jgi:hypothetical protein